MHIHLYCNSQFALLIAKNLIFHEYIKHIDVDFYFIRDEIVRHNLQQCYVPLTHKLEIHLQKRWVVVSFMPSVESWAFEVRMYQLEGVTFGISSKWHIKIVTSSNQQFHALMVTTSIGLC